MVKYYGRARQRTGSVNTNQLGLKMSGSAPSVGRKPSMNRYVSRRVNSCMGVCNTQGIMYHGVAYPSKLTFRNTVPYCRAPVSKCLAAAGGIRTIYIPYFKTTQPGKKGCGRS